MSPSGIKSRHQLAEFLSGEQSVSLLIWVLLANFQSPHGCITAISIVLLIGNWGLFPASRSCPVSCLMTPFLWLQNQQQGKLPVMLWISIPFSPCASFIHPSVFSISIFKNSCDYNGPTWYSRIINPLYFNAPFILVIWQSPFCQIR